MLVDYQKVQIFQADNHILQNVDSKIDEGEFIYITGRVGSGKSLLFKTMYCESDIEGDSDTKAEILDRDTTRVKCNEVFALRKEMGVISQDFQLLHDRDVYRNLYSVLKAMGWRDKNEINQRTDEVLNDVGMTEKKHKMSYELSGDEQQRIAITRALLNKPKIIIADEFTGSLDPETANHIVKLLKDIIQTGAAVMMSTHNIPVLDKFPGIVYRCENGHIEDIMNKCNKIDL